ncbi:MAG: heme-copper oxidase subunit III [Aquificaceae bacterium]|nr:heme-copper oxidase subunit III [Aquificaceae bacterium]MCX8060628.1 heme-copper oxidase subunit III [Aquificaceae bacterium]MDW8096858.1 heme-copper oxidase subunit III [Aquificaceae bacterium]
MAQHEVHHLGEHEYSYWPLPVGLSVLLLPISFIALMVWQKPMLALVFGGVSLVLLLLGTVGWINEFFSKGHEEGLGLPAMMFFIVSEVVIFGTMFVGFYMARVSQAEVWSQWVPKGMNLTIPLILTFILWASSATIAFAEKFFEMGRNTLSALFVLLTIVLGTAFMVIHIMEWLHLWHAGFTLSSNMYGTSFYMLTGIHTSHIVVGILTMIVALYILLAGKANQHKGHTYIKAITLYWHFVDIMWLLVASSAYLIGSLA